MNQKISIITASYNNASTIEDTINSIIEQNYANLSYYIIDGQSTDDTLSIIKKYSKNITNYISEKDNGIYDAFNKGLKLAEGEIIGFLNSDDFFADKNVLNDVAKLFKNPNIDAVYGDLNYIDFNNPNKIVRNWKANPYKKNSFKYGWMPPHPTLFIRKKYYEKYGYFNTNLISAADYELMLRFIHKYGIKLAYLPKVLINMRVGGISNSNLQNRLRANKEDRLAWKLNGLKMPFYTPILKPLRKITQFKIF
ncbi:MAG: glycosyltransferase, partial [Bacteroidales bacterium]|nr:glycosyltransferase [Bacteroidales bacterium]